MGNRWAITPRPNNRSTPSYGTAPPTRRLICILRTRPWNSPRRLAPAEANRLEARANGGGDQAFLWFGTAASAINLNPTSIVGIDSSAAVATNGSQQVGSGFENSSSTDDDQALIWSGSADSVFDLHSVLPAGGIWNFSNADGIDTYGNVFGIANGTFDGTTGYFAVEWSPVPEPSSLILVAFAGAGLLSRRRSTRSQPISNAHDL